MSYEKWKRRIRNPKTRSLYTSWVERFCEYHEVGPEDTLAWELDIIEDKMWDFQDYLQGDYPKDMARKTAKRLSKKLEKRVRPKPFEPLSRSSVKQAWNALRRWFKDHRLHIRVDPRDLPKKKRKYYNYIPDKGELKMILGQAKLKYKVAFSLIAYAGMRPSDVCNLRYDNIVASLLRDDEILEIRLQQQKTGEDYITFLAPEGTRYLKQLIGLRNDRLGPLSFVVSTTGKPLKTNSLRCYFNRLIENMIGKHPTKERATCLTVYSLRKYFRKNIGRRVTESEAEYLMGHKAGLESLPARYHGLADRDRDAIRLLKEKYRSALGTLEVDRQESLIDALKKELAEHISPKEMEDLTHGLGGGKAIKTEWDAELILSALTRALAK